MRTARREGRVPDWGRLLAPESGQRAKIDGHGHWSGPNSATCLTLSCFFFFFMPDSCMCYDRDTLPPVAWAGGRVRRWGWMIGIPEICTVRCMGSTVSSVILQYIPWYTIAIKLWDRDFKNDEWAPPPACLPHVESVPQRYCPLKTF